MLALGKQKDIYFDIHKFRQLNHHLQSLIHHSPCLQFLVVDRLPDSHPTWPEQCYLIFLMACRSLQQQQRKLRGHGPMARVHCRCRHQ